MIQGTSKNPRGRAEGLPLLEESGSRRKLEEAALREPMP